MKIFALILLMLIPSLAFATAAEETTTLTSAIATSVPGVRLTHFGKRYKGAGPIVIVTQGCTSCTTANPVWLPQTETRFEIGVSNSLGANKTNVSGHAVDVGGRSAECNLSPAQFKGFVDAAVGAGAGDPIARAAKDVQNTCLGGT